MMPPSSPARSATLSAHSRWPVEASDAASRREIYGNLSPPGAAMPPPEGSLMCAALHVARSLTSIPVEVNPNLGNASTLDALEFRDDDTTDNVRGV